MTNTYFKRIVKYQFQPPWFDGDCEKILLEKEKWRARAKSPTGSEEDYEKFRKLRKQFKKIMDEKMRLNFFYFKGLTSFPTALTANDRNRRIQVYQASDG